MSASTYNMVDADAVSTSQAAILAALMRDERHTVRSLAVVIGRSVNVTHRHLVALRDAGWVTWDDGKTGTLRPTFMALWPQ